MRWLSLSPLLMTGFLQFYGSYGHCSRPLFLDVASQAKFLRKRPGKQALKAACSATMSLTYVDGNVHINVHTTSGPSRPCLSHFEGQAKIVTSKYLFCWGFQASALQQAPSNHQANLVSIQHLLRGCSLQACMVSLLPFVASWNKMLHRMKALSGSVLPYARWIGN